MPESSSNSQQSLTTSSHVFLTFLSRPLTPKKARTEQVCDGHHWELMAWKIWELSLSSVSPKRYLEGDGFVGLCCHQEVLPAPIWGLNPLLIRRHEPMARHDAFCNLWVIDLQGDYGRFSMPP